MHTSRNWAMQPRAYAFYYGAGHLMVISPLMTEWSILTGLLDPRMSRASVSCFGRSGNSDLEHWWSQTNDEFILVTSQPGIRNNSDRETTVIVTEWGIRSWCWWSGFPVGQHYKVIMSAQLSQVGTHSDMTLDVTTMSTNKQRQTKTVCLREAGWYKCSMS